MSLVNVSALATISCPVVIENEMGLVRWGMEKPMSKAFLVKKVGNREV